MAAIAALLCLPAAAGAAPTLPAGFQDTTVFDNLAEPTALRFAPDGRIFVAEKAGKIEVYADLGDQSPEVMRTHCRRSRRLPLARWSRPNTTFPLTSS